MFSHLYQAKSLWKIPPRGVLLTHAEKEKLRWLYNNEPHIFSGNIVETTELVANNPKYLFYLEKLLLQKFPDVSHDWTSLVIRQLMRLFFKMILKPYLINKLVNLQKMFGWLNSKDLARSTYSASSPSASLAAASISSCSCDYSAMVPLAVFNRKTF